MSDKSEAVIIIEWVAIVVLIGFSGLFSGLNLGLMSLDPVGLEIVLGSDDPGHVRAAQKIKPLRDRGNWLLCTLLLGNVAVNAELSILLADKTSGTIGFVVSTALIVVFGEIIPQALCSRYALQIGAKTVWIVWPLMFAMAVLAWPISWVLDRILGEELGTMYSNKELSKLVDITARHRPDSMPKRTASILQGALELNDKFVSDIFTEMKNVFWLDEEEVLSFETLTRCFKAGHSRIPIFRKQNSVNYCIGLLYVKDLILIDPDDNLPIKKVLQQFDHHHTPIDVWRGDDLQSVLQTFISSRQHLAFVKDGFGPNDGPNAHKAPFVGIVTLEDLIEEILKMELIDEYDNYVDHHDLKSTTPRLKEINWSNSLFKNQGDLLAKDGNKHPTKPSQPQMLPHPVLIENEDKIQLEKEMKPKMMIRHSNSFKMLGMNQWDDHFVEKNKDNEEFQFLQVSYKSIQIQIKCAKNTVVQTINHQIVMDGYKVMEVDE